ncbi:2-polyprenylphenol 6-hydroxylase [Sneathiella sp.]|uniref:2-polyprenylphenol 6-hydroxylase n=1 Tax=Sneathiella sp. TaxID=1964365 RepID=UPI00356A2327
MIRIFNNFLRLLFIARTLARHDALFFLDKFDRLPFFILLGRKLLPIFALGTRRTAGLRDGERLANALQELGPSFIKLGQAMSVRADLLGEELVLDLGNLRDRIPPFPFEQARKTIEQELGASLEELYVEFDPVPIAAASIAQVHFAIVRDWVPAPTEDDPDATAPSLRKVAVKILRPGIEKAFETDLQLFFWLAGLAERYQPHFRRLRPTKVVETMADSVELEMDLRLEAAAASEMAENFTDDPEFDVPEIDWQRTGRRVITQSRIEGIAISKKDELIAAGHDLDALAGIVIRVFLHQVLRDGFFHADMHHGNLFVTDDGRLVAVDFGIMGRMSRETRLFMAEMLYAFLIGDYRRAAEVHFEAGYVPPHKSLDSFAQACRSIGEPILGRPVSEISIARLLVQLFQITETFEMETQPQLLLLQKTMVTAEGVAQSLHAKINFWEVAKPTVEDWMRENMGPEAQVAEILKDGIKLMRKLPTIVTRADKLLKDLETLEKVAEDRTDGIEERGARRRNRAGYLIGGIVVGGLAAYLLMLAS